MAVVCKVLADQVVQMAFAKDKKVIQTLALEGSEPCFRIRIRARRTAR